VILAHLYGWAARDTQAIRELCDKRQIPLIEDSAQAWGVRLDDQPLFAGARISTTSFFPGKVLGAAGDGGAVLTNDSSLALQVELLANHGRTGKFEHRLVGWNSRFDALQCAYLDLCLDHLPGRIRARRNALQTYRRQLGSERIRILGPEANIQENGYLSVVLLDPEDRKILQAGLAESEIGCGIVYPLPVSGQIGAHGFIAGSLDYGHASHACKAILNLPCFAGITEDEIQLTVSTVRQILADDERKPRKAV
jgi:dTDP-4-amino-4,6-dideoxygalactose transaminase